MWCDSIWIKINEWILEDLYNFGIVFVVCCDCDMLIVVGELFYVICVWCKLWEDIVGRFKGGMLVGIVVDGDISCGGIVI